MQVWYLPCMAFCHAQDESDDEADSGDEWDAGLIDGGVDEEADDGGDGDEGDAADEDDEDDEDDDSEALNAGPSFKKYANVPDRCYEEVLRTKYKFPTTPKITDNEELFATLVQLIKERKAYVKMGGKRTSPICHHDMHHCLCCCIMGSGLHN